MPPLPRKVVGVSIARLKNHPGIANFTHVSTDAGRSRKMIRRAKR